jgi:hypothetical protein
VVQKINELMIKQLRKRHLQIWALWAVLIPVWIIVAWMAVPKKVTQELLNPVTLRNTNVTLVSVEKENYKLSLLLDTAKDKDLLNLEFINKKKNDPPLLLLYRLTDTTTTNIDKQEILGRIGSRSPQYFPLTYIYIRSCFEFSNLAKFVLYDIERNNQ